MNINITWTDATHANTAWRVLVCLTLLCCHQLSLRAAEDVREHGRVTITNAGLHGPSGTHSTMKVSAYFRSSDPLPTIDAGSVVVAGVNVVPHVEGVNTVYMTQERSIAATNGRYVQIHVSGSTQNHLPGFIDSVYCPMAFQITAPISSPRTFTCEFERAKGLSLQWNADPRTDSVAIMIVPEFGGINSDDTPWFESMIMRRVEDRGQITIPPESFEVFPIGSRSFTVVLKRESRKLVEHEGKAFTLVGTATVFVNVTEADH